MKKGLLTLLLIIITALPAWASTNTSGPWGIWVSRGSGYTSYSTAKWSPTTAGKNMVVASILNVNTLTQPADRMVEVKRGGGFNVGDGKTLNMNGVTPVAGRYQIFFGGGAVINLPVALPEWFGENISPGTTDMAAAVTKALAASNVVELGNTTYAIGSTVSLATGNKTLRGVSGGNQSDQNTIIHHLASSTGELFNVGGSENGAAVIMNISITGGNGSFAIVSERPYVRYEYIHMEPYNGGGIQLKSTAGGSSSSTIHNCQWVGPPTATAYTGYEIDVNGGDVELDHVTAIRGAIGINVIKGQTIIINRASLNKQTRNPLVTGGPYSSASQFNTAGIKLTGSGLKQAISIRNSYIEACDNSIYVESVESLSIEDNLIADIGAAGNVGAWLADGNSSIYLKDANVKNVTIKNNNIYSESNGVVATPFYSIYLNAASNVLLFNNKITNEGDYSGNLYLTTSPTVFKLGNIQTASASSALPDYDPSFLMNNMDLKNGEEAWAVPTLEAGWSIPAGLLRYRMDAQGCIHIKGTVGGGSGVIFYLPPRYRPTEEKAFVIPATGALGIITVFTNGGVALTTGTSTGIYLDGITFKP